MGRRTAAAVATILAMAAALPAAARDEPLPRPDVPWASGWRSRAAVEWEAHRDLPWQPGPPAAFTWRAEAPRPHVEVLGFLPYWMVGQAVVPLERLTTLAYFAVEVRADGTLGDARDWGTPTLMPLVTAARQAGVRVVLAATCFDEAAMTSLLGSATLRAKAIDALVDRVAAGGGDGVNVDFEGLPYARKAQFTAFVGELKAALQETLGRSHVTVDTPAVDWDGAYDYDALALAGDGLVIMGYDYHYRGGDPGPVAPLAGSPTWGKYSLDWTLKDYDQFGGVANRGRFLLALPLYGYDWPTIGSTAPGESRGSGTARFYADCARRAADAGGWRWDDDSTTPWFAWQDGGWRQTWCEDLRSLKAKVALAAGRDLGGVAWWALGYEEGGDDPWDAIDAAWPPAGPADPAPEPVPEAAPDAQDAGPDGGRWDFAGGDGDPRLDGGGPGIELPWGFDGGAEGPGEAVGEGPAGDPADQDPGTDGTDGTAGDEGRPARGGSGCRAGTSSPAGAVALGAALALLAAAGTARRRRPGDRGASPAGGE